VDFKSFEGMSPEDVQESITRELVTLGRMMAESVIDERQRLEGD
jgi:hypothetical protein